MKNKALKIHVEFFPSREKKMVKLSGKATGIKLLKDLDLHLDAHIIVRDGAPIPMDEKLKDGDKIRILTVTSGG